MSIQNGTSLTKEALQYLAGLIRDISGLDSKHLKSIIYMSLDMDVAVGYPDKVMNWLFHLDRRLEDIKMKDITIITSEEKEVLVKNASLAMATANMIMTKTDKSDENNIIVDRKEWSSLVWAVKKLAEVILEPEENWWINRFMEGLIMASYSLKELIEMSTEQLIGCLVLHSSSMTKSSRQAEEKVF